MNVVLADDHRIVRDGLRLILSHDPDVTIVGEVEDGAELLALLEQTEVDVVLLDLKMPGLSGLEALERMQALDPPVRAVVLSMHDDPAYVKRAIELGAAGYLLKNVDREELLRALHLVAEGGSYIQGELAGALLASIAEEPRAGSAGRLDVDSLEVLGLLAAGMDNRRIAERIGISEAALKARLRAIYAVLGAKTRSEAVAMALRLGLMS
jgi:DNA-binding NarL/FixJ family response regulator